MQPKSSSIQLDITKSTREKISTCTVLLLHTLTENIQSYRHYFPTIYIISLQYNYNIFHPSTCYSIITNNLYTPAHQGIHNNDTSQFNQTFRHSCEILHPSVDQWRIVNSAQLLWNLSVPIWEKNNPKKTVKQSKICICHKSPSNIFHCKPWTKNCNTSIRML